MHATVRINAWRIRIREMMSGCEVSGLSASGLTSFHCNFIGGDSGGLPVALWLTRRQLSTSRPMSMSSYGLTCI